MHQPGEVPKLWADGGGIMDEVFPAGVVGEAGVSAGQLENNDKLGVFSVDDILIRWRFSILDIL